MITSESLQGELEKLLARSRELRTQVLDLDAEIERVAKLIAQDQKTKDESRGEERPG